jgi:hypothetical protein
MGASGKDMKELKISAGEAAIYPFSGFSLTNWSENSFGGLESSTSRKRHFPNLHDIIRDFHMN